MDSVLAGTQQRFMADRGNVPPLPLVRSSGMAVTVIPRVIRITCCAQCPWCQCPAETWRCYYPGQDERLLNVFDPARQLDPDCPLPEEAKG
jgi:hypothetical protein